MPAVEQAQPSAPAPWRRRLLLLAAIVASVAALALWWRYQTLHPSTDDAYVGANVVRVASRVGGQVESVAVVDHQRVARGEILFRLRDDLLRAELAAAHAALDQTGQQTGAGAAQVSAARAEVVRAEAALDGAEKSYGRTRALFDRGDVARAALDTAQAARDQALATRDAALAQLAAAQRQLGVTGAGNPTVRAAAARLAQAQIALSDATVRSPADGWIANLTLRPGAMVAAGQPLFALVEDGDWWIEANFKETDLDRIRPGQPARITLDMYPGATLEGRVESIGPGSGAVFSLLPPQNATGNWVKVTQRFPVRIRIGPAPDDPDRPLRIGASSTVRIDTTGPE